jgi:chromosome segregation ATPase
VHLTDSGAEQIGLYLQAKQLSSRVKEALQRALSLRDRISQTVAQRSRLEQRLKEIAQEQGRIRDNMGKLPQNSELYGRYVKKLDLQETETEKLQRDLDSLRAAEAGQRKDLSDYLQALDVE